MIRTFERWEKEGKSLLGSKAEYEVAAANLFAEFPQEPYVSASTRGIMASLVPYKINAYVNGLTKSTRGIVEDAHMRREIDILKSLTWTYVIEAPALAAQQEGQLRIVERLFSYFSDAAGKRIHVLPAWARAYLRDPEMLAHHDSEVDAQQRVACDVVASLSERQAHALYARLTGNDSGTVSMSIIV